MKQEDRRNVRNRKRRIAWRLRPREWPERPRPMFAASNIQYEMSARQRGVGAGGIGAIHLLARHVGLVRELDRVLHLLKRHLPYHESDHVLNLVYNIMYGNTRLEDMELLRQNESYMDMLGAQRIPDPTTAGDFLRRFTEADIVALLDAVNGIRRRLWLHLPREERRRAVIDGDGTDAPTDGEKKAGIGLSYKSIWGYGPLLISLANTREPLFIVNRSGSRPSHEGAAARVSRCAWHIELIPRSLGPRDGRIDGELGSRRLRFDFYGRRCQDKIPPAARHRSRSDIGRLVSVLRLGPSGDGLCSSYEQSCGRQ